MKDLTYEDAPYNWALCFQNECPLRDTCLRFAVGQLMPDSVTHHETVLPTARKDDRCCHYVEAKPVRMARGMMGLLPDVPYEVGVALRKHLYTIFGSSSQYYRYREGRWLISPRQQERVAALFRQFGLKGEPHFDAYVDGYCFENK